MASWIKITNWIFTLLLLLGFGLMLAAGIIIEFNNTKDALTQWLFWIGVAFVVISVIVIVIAHVIQSNSTPKQKKNVKPVNNNNNINQDNKKATINCAQKGAAAGGASQKKPNLGTWFRQSFCK